VRFRGVREPIPALPISGEFLLRKLFRSALFLCCIFSFAHFLPAQSPFTLAGTVHDASGGRIPRAHVAIRVEGAAPAAEVETGEDGSFQAQLTAPGSYRVQVAAEGFEPLAAQALLTAEAPSARIDLPLTVAAIAETIEVTAEGLAAETTSTQLGETLDTKKIESVPLNGRGFTDLMAVQPGIVPANTAQPGR
jgi:hypothetical protein